MPVPGAGYLRTRVGRALLRRFLGAALLPVVVVTAVGLLEVRRALLDAADARVAQLSKSATLTLLGALATAVRDTSAADASSLPRVAPPDATSAAHLAAGGTLLLVHPVAGDGDALVELRRLDPAGGLRRHRLDGTRTFDALAEIVQGEQSVVCIFAGRATVRVHCSGEATPSLVAAMRTVVTDGDAGDTRGATALAGTHVLDRRQVFLRVEYGADTWYLVTAEPRAVVLAPLRRVTRLLVALVLLATVIAFALGHAQIRRSTGPLEQLQQATVRVTAGDLATPVRIASDDEYGALGDAFNTMTATVARQIRLLEGLDGIDEAALDERRADGVVDAALAHFVVIGHARRAAILLGDPVHPDRGRVIVLDRSHPRTRRTAIPFPVAERERLRAAPRQLVLDAAEARVRWPHLAPHVVAEGAECVVLLPLVHDGAPLGVLALECDGVHGAAHAGTRQLEDARRLADRLALGVANTMLLERLDALSIGAMRAFATAIDAASPWTAGHSERVTATAVALGRVLGCDDASLLLLERGALLHDIGKIGVPAEVLNKPGALTDEERRVIQRHPVVGEQILRPLPVFTDVLGIVRWHHERVDGRGYPDGLVGTAIPWLARIVAVADVFDALTSHRPYRPGMALDEAMAIIRRDAGSALDVQVVAALETLAGRGALLARTHGPPAAVEPEVEELPA
jgi:putative nucleotidyltransferase with HDIG domain